MNRALEADTTIYLAFYQLYIEKLLEVNPAIEIELWEGVVSAITDVSSIRCMKKRLKQGWKRIRRISWRCFRHLILSFWNKSLIKDWFIWRNFNHNYMKTFESLLLYIRASWEQSWQLHLTSLHYLCPYFFVYGMVNYACMALVYVSRMFAMQQNDEATLKLMVEVGYFRVNKSKVLFAETESDHGHEQENKNKVYGRYKRNCKSSKGFGQILRCLGRWAKFYQIFLRLSELMLERKNKMSIMKFLAQKMKESPSMLKTLRLSLKRVVQHSFVLATCSTYWQIK